MNDTSSGNFKSNNLLPGHEIDKPGLSQRWLHRFASALGLANGEGLKEKLEKALRTDEDGDEILSLEERTMLLNILTFGKLRVDDVMVSRANILAVDEDAPLEDLLRLFADAGHSRAPIYRGSLDEPLGMIHIKDLMRWMTQTAAETREQRASDKRLNFQGLDLSRSVNSLGLIREILYVPPSMPVLALLSRMQATRIHLALVIDEFGGTDGLVSIEDLIEEVVGDIEDEHDTQDGHLIAEGPNGVLIDGRIPLDELSDYLKTDLSLPEHDDETESVGGLILSILGRLPSPGERVLHPAGFEFEILTVSKQRINKLKLHRLSSPAAFAKDVERDDRQDKSAA